LQPVPGPGAGSEEEIKTFCSTTYGVTFPLFSKVDVNGEHRAPLYQNWLSRAAGRGAGRQRFLRADGQQRPGAAVRGRHSVEFRKIPAGPDGKVIQRFSPDMTPDDPQLVAAIKGALAK
jgi:glutathione peroxidase